MKTSKELKIGNPPKSVAGFKAITISIQQILQRMPFLKALKVLNKLNQKNGTDCPGCAWPDPNHRTKLGEFCENCIKAIDEEAMNAKASPEFFAKYSIKQLQ
jgi:hypothetical protein